MKSFKTAIRPPTQARITQANRRAVASNPNDMGSINSESFNFNDLNTILYQGRSDRIQRYYMYDMMDKDTDIARALDIIAEYCTLKDINNNIPFVLEIEEDVMSDEDSDLLQIMLKIWSKMNNWDNMLFRTVRTALKYGDAFFIRDKNFKLYPLHPSSVAGIYVDDNGRDILGYHLVNLTQNFDFLVKAPVSIQTRQSLLQPNKSHQATEGFMNRIYSGVAPVEHIVHLSLNEGRDTGGNGQNNDIWPFGESFLEQIYKDFRQRSLLEDAEVIHRIQRAPTRRVFYIDVTKMRPDRADAKLRKMKNEIQQKRVPSNYGGTDSVDTIYNPISQLEDIFVPVTADGRGTKIETLQGQDWSQSDALKYFNSKMLRGLRVPVSFMLGPDEGGAQYNDGRSGTAYIQEQQFSLICSRIQSIMDNDLDFEFKMFLDYRGVEIASNKFMVGFVPPMSFEEYRDDALWSARLQRMQTAMGIPHFAKRFVMSRFGNMSETDILDNERMWREENKPSEARQYNQDNELGGMGVGLAGGFGGMNDIAFGDEMGGMDDGTGMGNMGAGDTAGLGDTGGMGGGASAPPGGAAGGMGAGMEGVNRKSNKKLIIEDIVQPISKRDSRPPVAKNNAWGTGIDQVASSNDEVPTMKLSHIRKLRIERERNRTKMLRRMFQLSQQYGAQEDTSGGFI